MPAKQRIRKYYWTPKELADRWEMDPSTVYRMLNKGELKQYMLGGLKRVRNSDLLNYEKGCRIIKKPHGSS